MHSPALVPPVFDPGAVWLVGAGPGAQELPAPQVVRKAAIVLDEMLVSGEIFSLANPGTGGPRTGGSITRDATRPEPAVRISSPGKVVDQAVPAVTPRQRLKAWQQIAPITVVANQQQTRIAG
jgi:siroheme synthase